MDVQKRVSIPSEWRNESGSTSFMLIPGKDHTLQLYAPDVFEEQIMSKLKRISRTDAESLKKLRNLGSYTFTCDCDKQGRIQLPAKLIAYAELGKRIALIGSGDFAQIMSAERWEAEVAEHNLNDDSFLDLLNE